MKINSMQRTSGQEYSEDFKADNGEFPILYSSEALFTASSATETFQFSLSSKPTYNLLCICTYIGSGRESAFTFMASRAGNSSVSATMLNDANFGGVSVSVSSGGSGSVAIDVIDGVSGATLSVRTIRVF